MISSPRIQEICKQVSSQVVAEIGCDHAYITKSLLDNNKIKFAYLTDISSKCLEKAVANLQNYKKNTYFSVGDGLNALKNIRLIQEKFVQNQKYLPDENIPSFKDMQRIDDTNIKEYESGKKTTCKYPKVEQVIIAGMGGQEIIKILSSTEAKNYNNFILQPQKNIVELRIFLGQNNFEISSDELVREGKQYYFVLKVNRTNKEIPITTMQQYFGNPSNKETLKSYLTYELEKRKIISSKKKVLENETLIRLIEQYLLNL